MALSTFTMLCSHQHCFQNISPSPRETLSHWAVTPHSSSLQPPVTIILFVSMNLSIPHTRGMIPYLPFCVFHVPCFQGSSILLHVSEFHSFQWLNNILLYGCTTSVFPLKCQSTLGLFYGEYPRLNTVPSHPSLHSPTNFPSWNSFVWTPLP